MIIELYDINPEKLKRKVAQAYNVTPKRGERLMIPGKDDCIFISFYYGTSKATLRDVFNRIAQEYWKDRVTFKYKGLKEELIKDLWRFNKNG